jgi:hypothetical protein
MEKHSWPTIYNHSILLGEGGAAACGLERRIERAWQQFRERQNTKALRELRDNFSSVIYSLLCDSELGCIGAFGFEWFCLFVLLFCTPSFC